MTDPGKDAEVPCAQESEVGGKSREEMTHGARTREGGEEGRLMEDWTAGAW
ncbi:Hypothetical protein SMAX5B_001192, partial [Scophthalmus maximus]